MGREATKGAGRRKAAKSNSTPSLLCTQPAGSAGLSKSTTPYQVTARSQIFLQVVVIILLRDHGTREHSGIVITELQKPSTQGFPLQCFYSSAAEPPFCTNKMSCKNRSAPELVCLNQLYESPWRYLSNPTSLFQAGKLRLREVSLCSQAPSQPPPSTWSPLLSIYFSTLGWGPGLYKLKVHKVTGAVSKGICWIKHSFAGE